jgi:TfoX/Sxy family transcriptional regulator of competence genes
MAYDEGLAARVRALEPGLAEKKMFGGVAYLLAGNMAVGVQDGGLLVRVAPDEHAALLAQSGVRPFAMGGRTMSGWLLVDGTALDDDAVRTWVARGVTYAGSLPPK